jgi:hypothetical protein
VRHKKRWSISKGIVPWRNLSLLMVSQKFFGKIASLIMLFASHYYNAVIFHRINKPMFIGNPSAPISLKFML